MADRKRQIKIADTSKAGWMTIQQMEKGDKKNQTADEQKKVQIAEEAALKELDSRKRPKRTSDQLSQDGVIKTGADRSLFRGNSLPLCFVLFQRGA